ncbi:glycine betaine/L-proline ABC transporter ATP-binding protein ProV [Marinomonas sp. 15G1-11]|uniref:Quaternary amine transport ATP-binding protein n=1 Tax=Marinomonas phaeophyticola TaxID=3004091 RepID=A0ABT4JUG2_9GAMM|nr:glycine betaine/L-proline ABC transporter ATP-binding protein ProV [Marinomonas sp. 15G1-11]MCZ2721948.1 glycine betaine/L-proline ABC transporter ATP-binding protein ProV [Marinomonas sp. 15G1-11]
MEDSTDILSIRNVYKVFGDDPDTAMKMLDKGASKDEIFEKTGQTVGVFDASFTVKKGEIFVIMGLSGSGKSTMVRLLNRLIEPTSGTIELKGKNITALGDEDLLDVRRKEMSMVFQSFALMPHMSVIENSAFGLEISGVEKKERDKRALEALEQVGLGEHAASYPHQLSGGMQQRVGLARALTNDPTILLMDEAFSALDPLIRYEMQGELIRLQKEQERTIVFISHDLDEAIRIGDRIAIMEGGRVIQIGTPKEIMSNPENEYVETFFKGVDVSKFLMAQDIASQNIGLVIDRQTSVVPATFTNQTFAYLLDDKKKLQGILPLSEHDRSANISALLSKQIMQYKSVYDDAMVKSIVNIVAEAPYPVPVVKKDGTFCGVISKDLLLQTLSHG